MTHSTRTLCLQHWNMTITMTNVIRNCTAEFTMSNRLLKLEVNRYRLSCRVVTSSECFISICSAWMKLFNTLSEDTRLSVWERSRRSQDIRRPVTRPKTEKHIQTGTQGFISDAQIKHWVLCSLGLNLWMLVYTTG